MMIDASPPVILNPRGPSGSGKTELVRRLINEFLRYPGIAASRMEMIYRPGRPHPIAYQLSHPLGGAPLVVLGHYERTSGGCDTIRKSDGGLDEVFSLAGSSASAGRSVLMEGSLLSADHAGSNALAKAHQLHVLRLTTPVEQCARNLIRRRGLSRSALPELCRRTAKEQLRIEAACEMLCPREAVHNTAFEDGVRLACDLLGLSTRSLDEEPRHTAQAGMRFAE